MTAASFASGPSPMHTASGNGMRKSGVTLRKIGVLEPQIFGERIAEFLRGIHPTKTALCVEAETQISSKTIGKWLEGASSPSGNAYHRLIEVYGPELFVFVSPDASPASLREAARICAQARAERQRDAIEREIAALWGAR
ncbi:hypothetical protein [Methylobacterium radiodurans]|uniref:hypothetical protein n=1 Tax=Methylobacterium radiodurans TaxID=2202828 RepID=UPI0013A54175|nr:hypothetical protein [Methylobacterium radiodurans]